ncbi:MAG: PorT family protein, partial [Candidatus Delongbacteria bacterium]|nr:PorT family protein [Candidatus Delongbacteria bacterium]
MMKKLCLILLVFGLILSAAEPNLAQKTFKMGIYSGINLAGANREFTYNTDEWRNIEFKTRLGMQAGVMAELQLADKLYLQPEFRYIQKGGRVESEQYLPVTLTSFLWRDVKEVEKFDYMEIPILFKFAFAQSGGFKPYILAGPTFGFLSKAKSVVETEGIDEKSTYDVKDYVKSNDIGLDLGVGFDYPLTPKVDLFVDGRFGLGLTEIQEEESSYTKYKNQGIQVLVGLKYCFSGCEPQAVVEEEVREPVVIKEFDLADYNV